MDEGGGQKKAWQWKLEMGAGFGWKELRVCVIVCNIDSCP